VNVPGSRPNVTASGDRVVAGGAYTLTVGGGQPGGEAPAASADFRIDGTAAVSE